MEENEKWIVDNSIPSLPLQDPFVTQVNGEFIVGGVEVFDNVKLQNELLSRKFFAKLDAVCKGTRSNERYQTAAIRKKSDSCHDKTARKYFCKW